MSSQVANYQDALPLFNTQFFLNEFAYQLRDVKQYESAIKFTPSSVNQSFVNTLRNTAQDWT